MFLYLKLLFYFLSFSTKARSSFAKRKNCKKRIRAVKIPIPSSVPKTATGGANRAAERKTNKLSLNKIRRRHPFIFSPNRKKNEGHKKSSTKNTNLIFFFSSPRNAKEAPKRRTRGNKRQDQAPRRKAESLFPFPEAEGVRRLWQRMTRQT